MPGAAQRRAWLRSSLPSRWRWVSFGAGAVRLQRRHSDHRDAETEQLLRNTCSHFKVAGLSQQNVQVVIVNEDVFNAFVMDAHRIFIFTGALMEAKTPNQLIGVSPMRPDTSSAATVENARNSPTRDAAIVAMLLGVGAIAAGAKMAAPIWAMWAPP